MASPAWMTAPLATPAPPQGGDAQPAWMQAPRAAPSQPDMLSDVVQSAGSGLANGAMGFAGMPGDVASGIGQAAGWLSGLPIPLIGGKSPAEQSRIAHDARRAIPIAGGAPTSDEIRADVTKATGYKPYVPQTTAGKYAETAGSFVPAAAAFGLTGGMSAVPAAVTAGIASGLGSQGGGDLAATFGGESLRPYGALAGAIMGGGAPAAVRRVVTPFPAAPARTAAVNTLQDAGVTDLTAGQRTGNTGLRYAESEVGGPRIAATNDRQGEQFTRAVLAQAGVDSPRATTDVVNHAFARIGNDFDQIAAHNTLVADPQLQTDVTNATDQYFNHVGASNRAPIVVKYLQEIGDQIGANQGTIPGDVYKSIRSRIAADAKSASSSDAQMALNDMRDGLDAAMERSIAASNPADLGAWRDARSQYRNMLVIERAATASGEAAAQGLISPAQLRTATLAVTGRRAYARGNTPFDALARAGTTVMTPLPNSGTAGRTAARAVMSTPALVGAVLGGRAGGGDTLATAGGAMAGAATTAAARALLLSPRGRAYLANQAWLPGAGIPRAANMATLAANTTIPFRLPSGQPILGYGQPLPLGVR